MAEKFVSAQWKEEVKWSSTVTVQRTSGTAPWLQTATLPLVSFEQSSLPSVVSHSVAERPPPPTWG